MRDSDSAKLRVVGAPSADDPRAADAPSDPGSNSRPITLTGLGPLHQPVSGEEETTRVVVASRPSGAEKNDEWSVHDLPEPKAILRAQASDPVGPTDRPVAASVRPRAAPRSGSRAILWVALFAFVASSLTTVLVLRELLPGRGAVLVTAVGVAGMPVAGGRVLVDGAVVCSPVPCRVGRVWAGRRRIAVTAPGYQPTAEKIVSVESGSELLVHFALTPVKPNHRAPTPPQP